MNIDQAAKLLQQLGKKPVRKWVLWLMASVLVVANWLDDIWKEICDFFKGMFGG